VVLAILVQFYHQFTGAPIQAGSIQDGYDGGVDHAATDSDHLLGPGAAQSTAEHFAIPESWAVSDSTKTNVSLLFVVLMGGLAMAGIC